MACFMVIFLGPPSGLTTQPVMDRTVVSNVLTNVRREAFWAPPGRRGLMTRPPFATMTPAGARRDSATDADKAARTVKASRIRVRISLPLAGKKKNTDCGLSDRGPQLWTRLAPARRRC